MKTLVAFFLLVLSTLSYAREASPAQRRLICNQLVQHRFIERGYLQVCLANYDITATASKVQTTLVVKFEKIYSTDEANGAYSMDCSLTYRGTATRPTINRQGLQC